MPSWNIHIAHVEQLLDEYGASALGIRDENAFLVGTLVPDIYVGYMVPETTLLIDYKLTHLTKRCKTPLPDYERFWDFYIARQLEAKKLPTDMVLGAWAHLVCDHVHNARTRDLLVGRGMEQTDQTRIMKQADFDAYGKTLQISMKPKLTASVLDQARKFPQYTVLETDLDKAVVVAERIVDSNFSRLCLDDLQFDLLSRSFFHEANEEATHIIVDGLSKLSGTSPLY